MDCIASPWITGTSILSLPSHSSSSSSSSSSGFRVVCRAQFETKDLKFVLHDALDSSGIETIHARAARDGFSSQIQNLSDIDRQTSICINKRVELAKTALYIAAEDDSLISHSSVPLPVDDFLERLESLSTGFCAYSNTSLHTSSEALLDSLEKYFYVRKGFRRTSAGPKSYYLHSVLAQRCGSAVLLCLVYSEVLKILQRQGVIGFDVEIYYPDDHSSLPRAYNKLKGKVSDQQHILTSESLLVEILSALKDAYWPFQHDRSKSLFLRAVDAANFTPSGYELATAKAAQHRLERGVWTSVPLGDMTRALSACERLILLGANYEELRDYAILLYHCGYYEESLTYLKLYKEAEQASNSLNNPAEDATLDKLTNRLNLILMEESWKEPSKNFLHKSSEPW